MIFHIRLKIQSYLFRKLKPDDKGNNWLTLFNSARVRASSLEYLRGYFLDTFRQNLLSHPHGQNILQSISSQIWDFLFSRWCCLLTRWLEICELNDKFGFSGDNCKSKLPAKFCSHSFEWFCLQIRRDTKYFSSLVQGILIKG